MKKCIHWKYWLAVILLCAIILALLAYPSILPITSWDSPGMKNIQQEWNTLMKTARNTPGPEGDKKYGLKYEKLYEMLNDILRKRFSYGDLRRLAATCDSLPISNPDRSEFENAVLEYMVKEFVEAGDRDSLVELLSKRFPDPCYHSNIESLLARRCDKLKDPIVVLGDAYGRSKVPLVRRLIADALRRGFTSLGVKGKDDDDYVKNAMLWYKTNKEHLIPNTYMGYGPFPMQPYDVMQMIYKGTKAKMPEPQYEKHPPLFIEKPSTPEVKETQ